MLLVRRSLTQILKNLLRAGALACCLIPSMVEARLLQIIHTNDIHALYETAGSNKGGLAQLKYVIDQLRARAEAAGIDTLVTDGGDFTDGSIYRFSEAGAGPLRRLSFITNAGISPSEHPERVTRSIINFQEVQMAISRHW